MEASSTVPSNQAYTYTETERDHSTDGSPHRITGSHLNSFRISHATKSSQPSDSGECLLPCTGLEVEERMTSSDSPTSSSCSLLTNQKSLESRPPALSLETGQLPFSSLQSPLMKSLVSLTADRPTTESQRPALFDDHVASSYVPGSLHLVPDSTIERLVERLGAIPLIRQLAEDLAHRDRELVLFRLKADERERTLKKMLVEVEVSNADIEKRLAGCFSKQSYPDGVSDRDGDQESYIESINDMMQQALGEEDAFSTAPSASLSSCSADDRDDSNLATPKASLRIQGRAIRTDTDSIKSTSSQKSRGWRDYLWGTKADMGGSGNGDRRASVSSTTSRKVVSYEQPSTLSRVGTAQTPRSASRSSTYSTQMPLREDPSKISGSKVAKHLSSLAFHQSNNRDEFHLNSQFKAVAMAAESTPESPSPTLIHKFASDKAASLALKLVADARSLPGYTASSTSKSPVNTRGLNARQSSKLAAENSSMYDPHSSGARDDLQRIIARNSALHNSSQRKRAASISSTHSTRAGTLSNGKPCTTAKDRTSGAGLVSQGITPPDASLGPVEMDTIVPHAVQPPTLLQSWSEHYPADYLTDRFGFIYDKKHRSDRPDSPRSIVTVEGITGSSTEPAVKPSVRESTQRDGEDQCELPVRQVSNSGGALLYLAYIPTRSSRPTPKNSASLIGRMTRSSAAALAPTQGNLLSEVPLALRSQSGVTAVEESTVKLLLRQLSDMHDSLQRDRSIKWNEFLKKVRAERRRGEIEENGMPEALMADGELIGVSTLGSSGKGGKQKWKEFRRLSIGGIPVSYRWKVIVNHFPHKTR